MTDSVAEQAGQPSLATANTASAVRAILAAVGGWLVGKGWISNQLLAEISGVAVVVLPIVWAWFKNWSSHQALRAAIVAPAGKAVP